MLNVELDSCQNELLFLDFILPITLLGKRPVVVGIITTFDNCKP